MILMCQIQNKIVSSEEAQAPGKHSHLCCTDLFCPKNTRKYISNKSANVYLLEIWK